MFLFNLATKRGFLTRMGPEMGNSDRCGEFITMNHVILGLPEIAQHGKMIR